MDDKNVGNDSGAAPAVLARNVWHSYALAARREAMGERKPPEDGCVSRAKADLRGVDLKIERGSFVAVIGANGSGKSTFARHLNALLSLQEGSLQVAGLDVSDEDQTWELRRRCGMVFQNPENQFVSSLAGEDVAFGLANYGCTAAEAEGLAADALASVGLAGFSRADVHELSGGQQQRVALAGVIVLRPELIVLDEATSMLDPQGASEVLAAVLGVRKETSAAVIAITHDMEVAAAADEVVLMADGKVVSVGDPHEVLADERRLHSLGLRAPEAVRVWHGLEERGLVSGSCPVTLGELAEEVAARCG